MGGSICRMKSSLHIAFFGSSLVSCYWNGAATYYRGLLNALAARGHRVTFYEPDAFERQQHRDMPDPDWARVEVYSPDSASHVLSVVRQARDADLILKASGVGVHDELLEAAVLELQSVRTVVAFWDVDAPATLDRVQADPADPFRLLIPRYDLVFTYGGGQPVIDAYRALGARDCVPIYNALDPETHHPVPPDPRFRADLGFLGNRLPDRERRVEEFFLEVAASRPAFRFLFGGNGWGDKSRTPNVSYLGHVGTADHNAFNCTPTAVLNINRESMARYGFSPPTRIFEAAGAGACLITDAWVGIEEFLEPGKEVLVARTGSEVAEYLDQLQTNPQLARRVGRAALRRIGAHHTYAQRAVEVEAALEGREVAAGTFSARGRRGNRWILCPGRSRSRGVGTGDGAGNNGFLRYRYPRHAGQAGTRRTRIRDAYADSAVPTLSLVYRRAHVASARDAVRLALCATALLRRRSRNLPAQGWVEAMGSWILRHVQCGPSARARGIAARNGPT